MPYKISFVNTYIIKKGYDSQNPLPKIKKKEDF